MLPDGPSKRILILGVRWTAAAFVIWLIFKRIDVNGLAAVLQKTGWGWTGAALLLEAGRVLTGAAGAAWVMRSFGMHRRYLEIVRVNLQASFFGMASDWLGAAARWGGMAVRLNIPAGSALASIGTETYLVWILALALNVILWPVAQNVWQNSEEAKMYVLCLAAFASMLAAIAAGVRWFPRIRFFAKLHERFLDIRLKMLAPAAGWMTLQFLCSAQFLVVLADAVGYKLAFVPALWICGFANIIQSLPGALFGWSLRIGILVFLLPRMGGTAEQGAVIGLMSGLMSMTSVLVGAADFVLETKFRDNRAGASGR